MAVAVSLLEWIFLALGVGSLLFALISLLDGVSFLQRVSGSLRSVDGFQPKAVVLVPMRGSDRRFESTLQALKSQGYKDYRLVFIIDSDDRVDERLIEASKAGSLVIARSKPLDHCSGKISALIAGLQHVTQDDEVVVFADSDIVPDEHWLRNLVAPLKNPEVAASTGYRWYFPIRGGMGPALQSTWNSAAGSVMFSEKWAYLWGGSYAIRRDVLKGLKIEERWRRSLSDDMVMTRVLREKGHRIAFASGAMVANHTDATLAEAVRWTNRQSCLALLYAPAMRRLTLPYGLYAGSLLMAMTATGLAFAGLNVLYAVILLLSPVYLGLVKGSLRRAAFRRAMPAFRREFSRHRLWFYIATVLLPFLMLYNVRRARRMREFEWRGRVYRFSSAEDITVEKD